MYKYYQSSKRKYSTDCVIRSFMVATGKTWEEIYDELSLKAKKVKDLPNSSYVYPWWLKHNGFEKIYLEKLEDVDGRMRFPTVQEFALDHPKGTYILSMAGHLCCLKDGDWYDQWDCRYYKVRSVWIKKY